jgi:3D (Asp-Asp-Asp) domain-containing protein
MFKTKKLKLTKTEKVKIGLWYFIGALVMFTGITGTLAAQNEPVEHLKVIKVEIPIVYEMRRTTMYNAGDPYQTDSSPCIGATGENICTLIAQGEAVCATNREPFGTILSINGLGECVVKDRMNSRYQGGEIDWAMPADKKAEAIAWGAPYMKVTVK